jgi:hypothetical protein
LEAQDREDLDRCRFIASSLSFTTLLKYLPTNLLRNSRLCWGFYEPEALSPPTDGAPAIATLSLTSRSFFPSSLNRTNIVEDIFSRISLH